jgi:uncharacterized membrane protein
MAEAQPPTPPRRRGSRVTATFKALLRTRIMAGLLVVLPLYVTIWLVMVMFRLMRDSSQWVVLALLDNKWFQEHVWKLDIEGGQTLDVDELLTDYPMLDWGIAIVSVLLTIIILYAIGVFAANIFGRRIIDFFESFLDKVPLVKTVYRALKQIMATFAGEQSREYQRVALVPFPQERMRCVGFITATFKDSATGEELATVFIPTTPNPTTGYLQILKRKDLVELNWSVEEAVRTIMSGGILRPDFLTIVPGADQRAELPETRQPELKPPEEAAPDDAP